MRGTSHREVHALSRDTMISSAVLASHKSSPTCCMSNVIDVYRLSTFVSKLNQFFWYQRQPVSRHWAFLLEVTSYHTAFKLLHPIMARCVVLQIIVYAEWVHSSSIHSFIHGSPRRRLLATWRCCERTSAPTLTRESVYSTYSWASNTPGPTRETTQEPTRVCRLSSPDEISNGLSKNKPRNMPTQMPSIIDVPAVLYYGKIIKNGLSAPYFEDGWPNYYITEDVEFESQRKSQKPHRKPQIADYIYVHVHVASCRCWSFEL